MNQVVANRRILTDLVAQAKVQEQSEMELEIARLRAENARLKAQKQSGRIKVSAKGAVSVYGMGRWPVTLYRSQWEQLWAMKDEIVAFIDAHASELSVKDEE
jgi:hypothetical protein